MGSDDNNVQWSITMCIQKPYLWPIKYSIQILITSLDLNTNSILNMTLILNLNLNLILKLN